MRWDAVVPVWLASITDDADVRLVLGASPEFFMAGEREYSVPSLEYSIVSPGLEGELWETTLVQLDFWVRSMDQLKTLASALRRLLHHDLPITLSGIQMWSQFVGGRTLPGARDGVFNSSLDFQLKYPRSRYT